MSKAWGKIKEWLLRYGPAELFSTFMAMASGTLAYKITSNDIISAYIASTTEVASFYLVMISVEYRRFTKNHPWEIAKNLFFEFGPAELSDFLIIRPFSMTMGMRLFGQGIGLIIGKIVADFLFYLPVIIRYELRQKKNLLNK
jgi:hypothetical protein